MNGLDNLGELLSDLTQIALLHIILMIAGASLLMLIIQRLLTRVADALSGRLRLLLLATVPVVRLVIILATLVLIVTRLIEPTFQNLLTLLGALGLALGFAFRDYISSLIAGIVVLYEMPYHLGDWIRIDDAYGEVRAIGMRAAEIVTPDDTVVVVPHLILWDRLIYNANDGTTHLLCVTDFYLHPRHNAELVKRTLYDVALTSAYLAPDQPIEVIALEQPWGTHYRLKAYPVDPREQFVFITDLTLRGKAALAAFGVEFAAASAAVEFTP